jgi:hypothetical protein
MNLAPVVSTTEETALPLRTRPSCRDLATLPLGTVLYFALMETLAGGSASMREASLPM